MALTDSLIAWWDFDSDGSDSHSGGEDLTEVNGPHTYSSGKVALVRSGSDSFSIANANAGSFQVGTNDVSISSWVNVDSLAVEWIYRFGTFGSDGVGLRINADGSVTGFITYNSGTLLSVDSVSTLSTGALYHLSVVFDRDGNASLYINGVLDKVTNISASNGFSLSSTSDLGIGGVGGNSLDGDLYQESIWHRQLNVDELRWLYNRGAVRSYSEISGYTAPTQAAYSLANTQDFYDGQVDLTNNGTVTFAAGKVGNAASFSGSSQRLTSDSLLYKSVANESISIDCWFNADTISSAMGIAGQSNSSYSLQLLASGTLRFRINRATSGVTVVDWGTTLSAGTWYYVHAYHDAVNDVVGISVNDGTPVTTATGNEALLTSTDSWNIGSIGTGNYFDGLIDQVRFLRGSVLSTGDRTASYNGGSGAEFTSGGITGTLALTDGGETIAMSGGVLVSGTLAITDGADTLAMVGTVPVSGTLVLTDGADDIQFSGTQVATGTLALTDGGDDISLSGSVLVQGTLSITDGADDLVFSGSNQISGVLSLTDAGETLDFSGGVVISGTFTITDGGETIAFSDAVAGNVRDIALSATPFMSITMTAQPYVE